MKLQTSDDQADDSMKDSVLSSLCTKWMQLNVGLKKLDDINTTAHSEDSRYETNGTANKLILYSILDEFKLNDCQKPQPLDINIDRKAGYTGLGFISHIINESSGSVYILDVMSMPDPIALFGSTPKLLTHIPLPGEMFAYVYQEKYLVRAVRLEYECRDRANQQNQFSAMLIDIGCVVHIDVNANFRGLYEVTHQAETIRGYAKLCHLIQIPPKMCIYDLLHKRVHYKIVCNNSNLMFANILNEGVNPFAMEQKQFNFYMYFFGHNLNTTPVKKIESHRKPTSTPTKPPTPAVQVEKNHISLNPFADPTLYEIEDITIRPITDKRNPFYYDQEVETKKIKPKFLNFRLTKVLNGLSNDAAYNQTQQLTPIIAKDELKQQVTDEKKTNGFNGHETAMENIMKTQTKAKAPIPHSVAVTQNKTSMAVSAAEKPLRLDVITKPVEVKPIPKPYPTHEKLQLVQNTNNCDTKNREDVQKTAKIENNLEQTMDQPHAQKRVNDHNGFNKTPTTIPTKHIKSNSEESTKPMCDFPQSKKLPVIGETITLVYQFMINVEEFYAVISNDPSPGKDVNQFSVMFNSEEHTKHLVQYNHMRTPKLFDKVVALFDGLYYRAKIIKIIDDHVFQVFYVDYGNCAKVNTLQIFKYDEKWDEYPAYALHFRLNRVKEINPWDHLARQGIKQIMVIDCEATVVDIVYCEILKRNTYVVDVRDENGLNVAETLAHKNLAYYVKDSSIHGSAMYT